MRDRSSIFTSLFLVVALTFVFQQPGFSKENSSKSLATLQQLRMIDDRYAVRIAFDRHPELQKNAKALSEFAMNFANEGRQKEALDCAKRATAISPDDEYVLASSALVLHKSKNFTRALWAAKKAVKLNPNSRNLSIYSVILNSMGDTAQSAQALAQARRLEPNSWSVASATAEIALSELKGKEAYDAVSKYLANNPKDMRALLLRSRISEMLGKQNDRISDLTSVLKLKPDHAFALQKRAEACQRMKEYKSAVDDTRKLLLLDLDDPMKVIANKTQAECLESLGDLKGALSARAKMVSIEFGKFNWSNATPATLNRGFVDDVVDCCRLEVKLKQYDAALNKLNGVLLAYPNITRARELRANAFEGLSRWNDALSDWNRLISKQSIFPGWYESRARVYLKLGKEEAARRDLETAKKLSEMP